LETWEFAEDPRRIYGIIQGPPGSLPYSKVPRDKRSGYLRITTGSVEIDNGAALPSISTTAKAEGTT
jgi:hypothetical protein